MIALRIFIGDGGSVVVEYSIHVVFMCLGLGIRIETIIPVWWEVFVWFAYECVSDSYNWEWRG